ncbi:MAG TPA: YHS domain-containing protein [Thermoanaerobaculia bacterium]|nr:YHS domain-containing protein [Thermoanaerobaculia bacterium]
MKRLVCLALALAACKPGPPPSPRVESQTGIRTIDSADPRPTVIDPPPVLTDEAPPPKPKSPSERQQVTPLTPQDEQFRASLPFSPAIAMDPVDGSKVSIRATTPKFEYRNRIYYFSSEANRRTFAARPEQFTKGAFSHL